MTRVRGLLLLVLSILPSTATLLLILLDPTLSDPVETLGVWLTCTALFLLSALLSERLDRGLLSGYQNLAVLIGWFILGLPAALAVAVAGVTLAALVRWRFAVPVRQPLREVMRQAARCLLLSSAAVLVAAALFGLSGHATPEPSLEPRDLLPVLAALLGAFVTANGIGWVLTRQIPDTPPPEAQQYRALLGEVALFPLVVVLPLIYFHAGLTVFVLSMILIAAHVVRYYQIERQARETAVLANHLSLIHTSAQEIMYDLNQSNTLRVACRAALEVTQGDKAAVLLLDDDGEHLRLVESSGLSAAHQQRLLVLPYRAERHNGKPLVVPDIWQAAPGREAITPLDDDEFRGLVELPLHKNGMPLGYLAVYHRQPHVYSDNELYLLTILANQVAAALDNALLLQALELHAFETSHLVHLSDLLGSSLEPNRLGINIVTVLCQMFGLDYADIAHVDEPSGHLRPLGGSSAPFPLRDAAAINRLRAPLHMVQPGDVPLGAFLTEQQLASLLLLPLSQHEQMFAVIALGTVKPYRPDEHEQQLMVAAARQIGAQLYNALVHERTQQALDSRLSQLAQIERIVRQIASSQDFNDIITTVLEAAARTTQADMAALALLTEANDLWVIMHEFNNGSLHKSYLTQSQDEGVIGHVIRTRETALVADNRQIPYYLPTPSTAYLSSLAVPLVKDGDIIGVLDVESKQSSFFTEEQGSFLKNLAAHATISIQNARLLEELQYQVDILTSLRELSLQLSSVVDTATVAQSVLDTALHILDAQCAVLFRHEDHTGRLALLASREVTTPSDHLVDLLRQTAYRAVASGRMEIVEDAPQPDGQRVGLLAMPIERGHVIHEVLCLVFMDQHHFQSRDINTLALLAIQAGGHLENVRLHQRIREGNDRMTAILDSTRDGVLLLDRQGRIAQVNPSAERLLGINLGEHLGENYLKVLLDYADPDEQGYAGYSLAELNRMIRSPWPEQGYLTRRQFERRTPQNQIIHIEETSSPVSGREAQFAGRLLVLRDITEQKQLEVYREQITNMIIHNLRGPLSSIINGIRLAKENIPNVSSYPTAVQTLDLAADSARRLMDMVSSLMDIAKLEARQLALNETIVSVGDLIQSAYRDLLPSFQKAGISVELVIPPDLPPVRVDSDKMHRVLTNLLDNALRFTPAAGQVQVSAAAERGRLVVRVADSGPGIPEAEREHIFEKYRQLAGSEPLRGHKGSGLGLTFCRLVIEAHGQSIWVESGPLPGACFAFTLPFT
ncbi:MAG: GAF domain-containing protein [Chloroflexi bacterium]|nr:GAF domain-containing protein [Chloroflexota bacterium]